MTSFTTDTSLMRTKSAHVLTTAEQLRAEVATMQASLTELQGSWVGGASNNFHALVQEWRAVQQRVEESLQSISQALTTASTRYDEAEQGNAAMFVG